MFPWDHLAIGYVVYSIVVRLLGSRPSDEEWLAIVVGSQFPDLVDKPLAWTLGVLPSGTSLAHSVLVATPVVAILLLVSAQYGRVRTGVAFGLAYLLHLPADILYGPLISGNLSGIDYGIILWPLVAQPFGGPSEGLFTTAAYYIGRYYVYLQSPEAIGYFLLEVAFLGAAFALWVADGKPGLEYVVPTYRRLRGEVQ
jgi:hypothetical protein